MNGNSLQAATVFLDSWLGYRARQLDLPGFSVAIYHKDKVVFSQAYGLANVERSEPLTTQRLFGVASQSKMFTATAVLQLVEQGKLRLDDFACDCLPWLAEHRDKRLQKITVRELLSHSAGLIRDGLETDFWALERPFPDSASLRKMVLAADIAVEPNTTLKYSNLGFALLGQIVEAASGQKHVEFVTEHIIKPLNLKSTFADYAPALDKRLATAYGVPYEHYRPVLWPRQTTNAFASAVGIHATTEDMCQFAAAHFFGNDKLIGNRLKREAQRTHWTASGYDQGMALGLGFEIQHIGERRVVGHGGHLAGYLTATLFDPHGQTAVAVLANSKDAPSTQIARGVFEALDFFAKHAGKPTPKNLARFNTRLCNATAAVEIVATGNRIAAIDPDDWEPFTWAEELTQIDASTLRVSTSGSVFNTGELVRYTFEKDGVRSVKYAGATLLPEPEYRRLLLQKTSTK
jgi:CubicO group peptidase (beta-lactamase class C family)